MTNASGKMLRQRRERLGISRAQVARSTGVPEDYLRALDAGLERRGAPSPAYDAAWGRTVERFLTRAEARIARGLPWDASTRSSSGSRQAPPTFAAPGEDLPLTPRPVQVSVRDVAGAGEQMSRRYYRRRWLASVSMLVAPVVLATWSVLLVEHWMSLPPPAPRAFEVEVEVTRPGDMRVDLDGEPVLDRRVERGEAYRWQGYDAVVLDLADPFAVNVTFNGQKIKPGGHRDQPRRMVFVAEEHAR